MKRFPRLILAAALGGALTLAVLKLWFAPHLGPPVEVDYKIPGNPQPKIIAAKAAAIERRERQVAETIWAKEMAAQRRGRVIEDFWDALNASTNRWEVVRRFTPGELVLGKWDQLEKLPHDIEIRRSQGSGERILNPAWLHRLAQFENTGWRISAVEFRHRRFDIDAANGDRSGFYFAANLTNALRPARVSIEGDLDIAWAEHPSIRSIDASRLTIKSREGPPAFEPWLEFEMPRDLNDPAMEPLLVVDFDNDGALELAAAGGNHVWQLRDGQWHRSPFLKGHGTSSAVAADFNGDGATDLLAVRRGDLTLFPGPWRAGIPWEGRVISRLALPGAMVLTCGDIDADGDLDVFHGAYRGPFKGGTMPTPYYDANDSYPSFLLLNNGAGLFTDATEQSGLGAKRHRHVYAASFVDLDSDHDLDLVITSDFHGLDIYWNDGRGQFRDVTRDWVAEPWGFGMAHTFSDFNNDGLLDLLMIGMTSPTASRLEHLGLNRPDSRFDPSMRAKMTYGNRLLLGQSNGGFTNSSTLGETIRDAGWAWGAAAADFDNDGWVDLYIANGLESNQSVRDYESQFWLHDVFVGTSEVNPIAQQYFDLKGGRLRSRDGYSFGGSDRNRLFLNRRGLKFEEAAHLLGLAFQEDSRACLAGDLNSDGKVELLLTTAEIWPRRSNRFVVFQNCLRENGNWISARFGSTRDALNARVFAEFGGLRTARQFVTGASYNSQNSAGLHLGLGSADVAKVQIRSGSTYSETFLSNRMSLEVSETNPPKD